MALLPPPGVDNTPSDYNIQKDMGGTFSKQFIAREDAQIEAARAAIAAGRPNEEMGTGTVSTSSFMPDLLIITFIH